MGRTAGRTAGRGATGTAARQRLAPEQRRAQLLELGWRLFASMPYDEVHIERVAEQAGVSRGLLYHYFPTKRAFFAELVRGATRELAAATEPTGEEPLAQLVSGVQHYLEHVRRHEHATRAMHRGAASADVEVQRILEESTGLFVERIVGVLEPDREPAELLRAAVRSWVHLMRNAGQELLAHPDLVVAEVRDLCVSAFVGLVSALPDHARPARVDEVLRA